VTAWTAQIDKHSVILPAGITEAMNGQIPDMLLSYVFNGRGVRKGRLNHPAARSLQAMVRQALLDGVPADQIDWTDTYRDLPTQKRLIAERYTDSPLPGSKSSRVCDGKRIYLRPGEATAACAGHSNHGYGTAIDKSGGKAWHAWLEAHAHEYGWEWELASEEWHLHYWAGDQIPPAVLNNEKAHGSTPTTEEPDMDPNDKARAAHIEQMLVNMAVNGMFDWDQEGGDSNGIGLTDDGRCVQVFWDGTQHVARELVPKGQAVRIFAGPRQSQPRRTEVQVEIKGGKIRWLVIDANRAGFPDQGDLPEGTHLVSNGGGWHYTDIDL
jgi:hypothetical protein